MATDHAPARSTGSRVDLSPLDAQLQGKDISDAILSTQYYFATAEVSAQELLRLARTQQLLAEAKSSHRLNLYQKSVFGLPLLDERSRFTKFWRQLMMLIDLTYTTFYIPITLALYSRYGTTTQEATVLFAIDAVTGAFFAFNMVQQLHVRVRVAAGFYQLLVQYGQGIAYIYRQKGTFWLDLATTVPWVMQLVMPFLAPTPSRIVASIMLMLRLMRLVRVVSLVKILARGDMAPHTSRRFLTVGSWYLLSLAFCSLASINLLACIWYLAGSASASSYGYEDTWWDSVGGRDLSGAPAWDRYLAAVYFTVTAITTVGFGDITAKNNLEMVIAILIMIAGALFMSVIIGTVASLINSTSAGAMRSQAFRQKVTYLDRFFHHLPVGRHLERDVYEYYYYAWSSCQQEQQEWLEVVTDLPSGLRGTLVAALLRRSCQGLLDQLGAGVPEVLLLELCSCFKRHVMPPGMTLAVAGEGADCLWLLRHGSIMAIQPGALMSAAFSQFIMDDVTLADMWRPPDARKAPPEGAEQGSRMSYLGRCFKPQTAKPPGDAEMAHDIDQQLQQQWQQQPQQAHGGERHADVELAAAAHMNHLHAGRAPTASKTTEHRSASQSATARQPSSSSASQVSNHPSSCQVSSRQQLLQLLESEGNLSVLTGPCMFPGYVLQQEPLVPDAAASPHLAAAPLSAACPPQTAADGDAATHDNQGATAASTNAAGSHATAAPSSLPDCCWQSAQHPIWLRTYSLCVMYSIDIGVVRALCEVCPQLYANLAKLLML